MIRSGHTVQESPDFRLLSEQQVEEIHQASLEILSRTGSRVFSEDGMALLRKAGADISDGNLVRISPHLVEWALRCSPHGVAIADRDGKRVMFLEGNRTYFGTGSARPTIIDLETGERRLVLRKDVENGMRLCDALPNIDFVMSMGLASDAPKPTLDRHQFEAMVLNTVKPILYLARDRDALCDIVEMAAVVAGGMDELRRNPFMILYAEPTTPLKHSKEAVEKLLFLAENNLPVIYTSGMMIGVNGPATIAGCLALAGAESLMGLVMVQLEREGTPFIAGGGAFPVNKETRRPAFGSPEMHLMAAGLAALAHYHKLPMFSGAGATDSKTFDQQATIEGSLSPLTRALLGANLVHGVGVLEGSSTTSYEMLLAMDEVISMVKFIMNGIEVDAETLALNVIDKVGPDGNFLAEEHTLKHYRRGWSPRFMDRCNYETWADDGKRTMGDRLNKMAREILSDYRPIPLAPANAERIRQIVRAADSKLG
jgi:trimethylamine--corrinoid protein Co-methyltransferase